MESVKPQAVIKQRWADSPKALSQTIEGAVSIRVNADPDHQLIIERGHKGGLWLLLANVWVGETVVYPARPALNSCREHFACDATRGL